jgi:MATH domain
MSTSAVFSRAGVLADTLHRFCKKEHDWGWKKFMELNKVFDGFTVDNQLVIKAQVQV